MRDPSGRGPGARLSDGLGFQAEAGFGNGQPTTSLPLSPAQCPAITATAANRQQPQPATTRTDPISRPRDARARGPVAKRQFVKESRRRNQPLVADDMGICARQRRQHRHDPSESSSPRHRRNQLNTRKRRLLRAGGLPAARNVLHSPTVLIQPCLVTSGRIPNRTCTHNKAARCAVTGRRRGTQNTLVLPARGPARPRGRWGDGLVWRPRAWPRQSGRSARVRAPGLPSGQLLSNPDLRVRCSCAGWLSIAAGLLSAVAWYQVA